MRACQVSLFAALAAVAVSACDSGKVQELEPEPGYRAQPAQPAQREEKRKVHPGVGKLQMGQPKPAAAAGADKQAGKDIHWPDSVTWRSYEQGLAEAKRDGKPVLLLVYADWCPKCRALAPLFAEKDVAALADKMVMVRQDSDDAASAGFLKTGDFASLGGYVPRIFFLDSNGTLLKDVTSGNARYPYFYTKNQKAVLTASMRKALGDA